MTQRLSRETNFKVFFYTNAQLLQNSTSSIHNQMMQIIIDDCHRAWTHFLSISVPGSSTHGGFRKPLNGVAVGSQIHDWHSRNLHNILSISHTHAKDSTLLWSMPNHLKSFRKYVATCAGIKCDFRQTYSTFRILRRKSLSHVATM